MRGCGAFGLLNAPLRWAAAGAWLAGRHREAPVAMAGPRTRCRSTLKGAGGPSEQSPSPSRGIATRPGEATAPAGAVDGPLAMTFLLGAAGPGPGVVPGDRLVARRLGRRRR